MSYKDVTYCACDGCLRAHKVNGSDDLPEHWVKVVKNTHGEIAKQFCSVCWLACLNALENIPTVDRASRVP